jgi:hypothetical protein
MASKDVQFVAAAAFHASDKAVTTPPASVVDLI